MFTVTHFRSEFIHQGQATILRRVTMTQFLLALAATAIGVGMLRVPFWLAPLFIAAGYTYHGDILLRRLLAILTVHVRRFLGAPRLVNVQAQWDELVAANPGLVPGPVRIGTENAYLPLRDSPFPDQALWVSGLTGGVRQCAPASLSGSSLFPVAYLQQ